MRVYLAADAEALRLGGQQIEVVAILSKDAALGYDVDDGDDDGDCDDADEKMVEALADQDDSKQQRPVRRSKKTDGDDSATTMATEATTTSSSSVPYASNSDACFQRWKLHQFFFYLKIFSFSLPCQSSSHDAWERAAHHPPISLVHRLHCLAWRPLPTTFPFQAELPSATISDATGQIFLFRLSSSKVNLK